MINQLKWLLLELKLMYYYPHLVHSSWLAELSKSDQYYDELLATIKRLDPIYEEEVGFNMDTPSGKLVMSKLCTPKGKNKSMLEG
jgi:hypothetical protein